MTEIENFHPRPSADLATPIDDFHFILENNFLDLVKMEWWLIKYENLFKETYNFFYNEFLYRKVNGDIVRLPDFNVDYYDEYKRFTDLYKVLNDISFLHKNESYFKNELVHYFQISHSKKEARKWLIKNENIGAKCYLYVSLNGLEDFDMLTDRKNICYLKGFDFTINRNDFFYSPKFYKLYKHLFYIKRLYPESQTLIEADRLIDNMEGNNMEEHLELLKTAEDENKWGDENEEWARIIRK